MLATSCCSGGPPEGQHSTGIKVALVNMVLYLLAAYVLMSHSFLILLTI